MDKSFLVVVLSLQVFLLITAFTSTDAAAPVKDDQLQPPLDLVKDIRMPKRKYPRFAWHCGLRPGDCSGFRRPPTEPPIKQNMENTKIEEILMLTKQNKQEKPQPKYQRFPFLCNLKRGGCSLLGKVEPPKKPELELIK